MQPFNDRRVDVEAHRPGLGRLRPQIGGRPQNDDHTLDLGRIAGLDEGIERNKAAGKELILETAELIDRRRRVERSAVVAAEA